MPKIIIIGATTWGTTLSIALGNAGYNVNLLTRSKTEASKIENKRENQKLLPGFKLPSNVTINHLPKDCLDDADMLVFAVPSRRIRENAKNIVKHVNASTIITSASKGLESDSGKRISQVIDEEFKSIGLKNPVCALSGPNLALEIASGNPALSVLACTEIETAQKAQSLINSSKFRVYANDDIIGVELGGALKNIIAIGSGICDGLEFGVNAKAAFIARGLSEIARLGVSAGAKPITFSGLAGMGDLIATCSSNLSRNHTVGTLLSKGASLNEILSSMHHVAEGIDTTKAALGLSRKLNVEMPITEGIYSIIFDNKPINEAIDELMSRNPQLENWV